MLRYLYTWLGELTLLFHLSKLPCVSPQPPYCISEAPGALGQSFSVPGTIAECPLWLWTDEVGRCPLPGGTFSETIFCDLTNAPLPCTSWYVRLGVVHFHNLHTLPRCFTACSVLEGEATQSTSGHPLRSEVGLTAQILVVMGLLTQLRVWLRLKIGLLSSQSIAAAWVLSGQPCWLKVA